MKSYPTENTGNNLLKTLVIASQPEEETDFFLENIDDCVNRPDVILIKNPGNMDSLRSQLAEHAGQFDRVVISSHGGKSPAGPTMWIVENDKYVPVTDVVGAINRDNKEFVKEIHIASCHIGSAFKEVQENQAGSKYRQGLQDQLVEGQGLFLHGDDRVSLTPDSQIIIRSVIENPSGPITNSFLSLIQPLQVVVRQKGGSSRGRSKLATASYNIHENQFGRGVNFVNSLKYLQEFMTSGQQFERDNGLLLDADAEEKLDGLIFGGGVQRLLSSEFISDIFRASDKEEEKKIIQEWRPIFTRKVKNLDIDFYQDEGKTALHVAVESNKYLLTEFLLDIGASHNIGDGRGFTPLILASEKGFTDIEKLLLLSDKLSSSDLTATNNNGWSSLMYASSNGRMDILELMVEHFKEFVKEDPSLNVSDFLDALTSKNNTAALIATKNGHPEIVEQLLKEGANANIPNSEGFTILMYASQEGSVNLAKAAMAEATINDLMVTNKDGWSALMYASSNGRMDIVELMVERVKEFAKEDPSLNVSDFLDAINLNNNTAALLATKNGYFEIAEQLLKEGANTNIPNSEEFTILMYASQEGSVNLAKAAMAEATINDLMATNDGGGSALMYASSNGSMDIVELMLECFKEFAKEDPSLNVSDFLDALTSKNNTAALIATKNGHFEIAEHLLKEGANANIPDSEGFTILMYASQEGSVNLAKAAMAEATINDLMATNNDGWSALRISDAEGYTEISKLITEKFEGLRINQEEVRKVKEEKVKNPEQKELTDNHQSKEDDVFSPHPDKPGGAIFDLDLPVPHIEVDGWLDTGENQNNTESPVIEVPSSTQNTSYPKVFIPEPDIELPLTQEELDKSLKPTFLGSNPPLSEAESKGSVNPSSALSEDESDNEVEEGIVGKSPGVDVMLRGSRHKSVKDLEDSKKLGSSVNLGDVVKHNPEAAIVVLTAALAVAFLSKFVGSSRLKQEKTDRQLV